MERKLIELLSLAIEKKASDIHLTILYDVVNVQFRVNEQMLSIEDLECSSKLFRYIQYRANLDVSQILIPQTGQFEMEIHNKVYALRFAVVHSHQMVSGVLRILNADFNLCIEDLTFSIKQTNVLKKCLNHRSGLILLSGPTGSGKTTTLYTLLNQVQKRKIFTLEDPIEIYNRRYVQLQINEKQNLGYQEGIKQLLRHDPDILVIGEIRDEIAAKMALRSALTGHLVVTTIHSFSCITAIERMLELNISKSQLKEVLLMVSNQRLYTIKNKKEKTGVYEIMSKKHIEQYFSESELFGFSALQNEIEIGIKKGLLGIKQTQIDKVD